MPAELAVHRRLRHLARLQGKCGGSEFRHHLVLLEEAEIAALLRAAGVLAVLLGERREVRAALELGDDLLRLGLVVHQDVLGVDLLFARLAGDILVVAGMHRLVGDAGSDRLAQHGGLQRPVLRRGDLALHRRYPCPGPTCAPRTTSARPSIS